MSDYERSWTEEEAKYYADKTASVTNEDELDSQTWGILHNTDPEEFAYRVYCNLPQSLRIELFERYYPDWLDARTWDTYRSKDRYHDRNCRPARLMARAKAENNVYSPSHVEKELTRFKQVMETEVIRLGQVVEYLSREEEEATANVEKPFGKDTGEK